MKRFYRVPIEEIAYVRAVLEGYDGVAVLTAVSADRGEIAWLIGEGLEEEAQAIARKLAVETGLQEIPEPRDWGSPTE